MAKQSKTVGPAELNRGLHEWDFPTRKFACPPEIFGEGKYILRKRFMKVKAVRAIQSAISEKQVFDLLAQYIVEWNLDDVETGEPLTQPHQNPDAFDDLDILEQFPWLLETLFINPPNFKKGR